MTRRSLRTAGAWVLALAALGAGERWFSGAAEAQAGGRVSAPAFEVDPVWPKPLPNHWILGSAIGVWVDKTDHIWIIHRGASTLDPNENALGGKLSKNCCQAAPPVLEFDQDGNLVQSWGGPGQGYEWPDSNHGIFVETNGTVWIAGNGSHDGQLLKFTRDGKFIKQFGFAWANAGSTDTFAFRQPAKIFVDEPNKEAYIADGYGNHRVVVLDSDSGKVKRLWGAYGNVPDDKAPKSATTSGKRPSTTPPCEAGTSCIAKPVQTGKPMIVKKAPIESGIISFRRGQDRLNTLKTKIAMMPASAARPPVTNQGSSDCTAIRVIGSVTPKMMTPMVPRIRPSVSRERELIMSRSLQERSAIRKGTRSAPSASARPESSHPAIGDAPHRQARQRGDGVHGDVTRRLGAAHIHPRQRQKRLGLLQRSFILQARLHAALRQVQNRLALVHR